MPGRGQDRGQNKRKQKGHYKNQVAQSKKTAELQKNGLMGFMITCEQYKEKRCVKECYNIFQNAVEMCYQEEKGGKDKLAHWIRTMVEKDRTEREEEMEAQRVRKLQKKEEEAASYIEKKKKDENGEDESKAAVDATVKETSPEAEEVKPPAEHPEPKAIKGPATTLDQELSDLKHKNDKIWFNFDTGTSGIIFIKMLDCFRGHIDVNRLSEYIIGQAKNEQECDEDIAQQSRFICRCVPISCLCKASGNMAELTRLLKPWITEFFNKLLKQKIEEKERKRKEREAEKEQTEGEAKRPESVHIAFSYCIEFKNKTNGKVKRQEVVELLTSLINEAKANVGEDEPADEGAEVAGTSQKMKREVTVHTWIDYKFGDYDFVVEVFRDLFMFGIVPNYKENKKYNLQTLQDDQIINKNPIQETKKAVEEDEDNVENEAQQEEEDGFDNEKVVFDKEKENGNDDNKESDSDDGPEGEVKLI